MSDWFFALSAVVLLFFSALFSGAETGVYSVSRVRLEAEAGQGRRAARILSGLLRDDAGLLITLLVGANLVQDLAALAFQAEIESWVSLPAYSRELVVTAILTPFLFFFGEVLPKDVFRRRPVLKAFDWPLLLLRAL